jgi:multicomponent Na+:H+ antiporter subunit D
MTISALLCIGVGSYPQVLYSLLPFEVEYTPYDTTHVLTQLQLLFFSALAFVWLNLKGMYPPELPSTNLDVEWLYRKPLPQFLNATFDWILQWQSIIRVQAMAIVARLIDRISEYHADEGVFARTWQTGWIVFWVLVVMAVYLEVGLF